MATNRSTPTMDRTNDARTHDTVLCFREAAGLDELETLFRLRYRVYRDSAVGQLESANPVGFNVDPWDRFSSHFGLFAETGEGPDEAVGYLRVVECPVRPTSRDVVDLARRRPGAGPPLTQPRFAYPCLTYWPEPEAEDAVTRWSFSRGGLVEASRISVVPGLPISASAFVIHAAIATFFFHRGAAAAVLASSAVHGRMYGRLGFRRIPGTTDLVLPGVSDDGHQSSIRMAHPWSVPTALRPKFESMAAEYRAEGAIRNRTVARRACA